MELDEEPSYLIQNCHLVSDEGLRKYPYYSDQDDVFIASEDVLTVVDPSPAVAKKYLVMLESKTDKKDTDE